MKLGGVSKISILMALLMTNVLFFQNCGQMSSVSDAGIASPGAGAVPQDGNFQSGIQCPTGFLPVPKNLNYDGKDFCVMKYEAKDDGGGSTYSAAAGAPIVLIDRYTAAAKCRALGNQFDLLTNDQWQTLARNIASQPENWSSGVVGRGLLNRGNSNGAIEFGQPASDDETGNCASTGQSCSRVSWNITRRTHVLSNGQLIWDIAGNVYEWMSDDNTLTFTNDSYMSFFTSGESQRRYGPSTEIVCDSPSSGEYCGMGYANVRSSGAGIARGGDYSHVTRCGIFATALSPPSGKGYNYGFRCAYTP